jgi:hypothetical protein
MYTISLSTDYIPNAHTNFSNKQVQVSVPPRVGDLYCIYGVTYRVTKVVYYLFPASAVVEDEDSIAQVFVLPIESENYDDKPF